MIITVLVINNNGNNSTKIIIIIIKLVVVININTDNAYNKSDHNQDTKKNPQYQLTWVNKVTNTVKYNCHHPYRCKGINH